MTPRRIVLVSGTPAAGKTTLAGPLAEALGFPLLSKDHIKETLHDALDAPNGDPDSSRRLGGAAMELTWALAARCPSAVLEANFRPNWPGLPRQLAALSADVVEVHCWCPPEEAARRFAARARAPSRHAVHLPFPELDLSGLAEEYAPLGRGTVISVDTTAPVDSAVLAARVRRAFEGGVDSG